MKKDLVSETKRRTNNLVLYVTSTAIDLVSIPFSKHNEFMNSYCHDILLPFWAYNSMRFLTPKISSRLFSVSYAFLGCSAFEVAQKFELYHGTYDPKDFLAYATGVGLAVAIDKLTSRKKKLGEGK